MKMHLDLVKREVTTVSEFGVFASRFAVNNRSLENFDLALNAFRKHDNSGLSDSDKHICHLLEVLKPLSEVIQSRLSESISISERSVLRILKDRNSADWKTYKESIINLVKKLEEGDHELSKRETSILNDIGDALDSECAHLFRRIRER